MDKAHSKLLALWMKTEKGSGKESHPLIIGDFNQIFSICKDAKVERIIVALDERRGKLPVEQLLACRMKGIRVEDAVSFVEEFNGRISVESLYPSALIFSEGFRSSRLFKKAKKYFDAVVAAFALVLAFPIGFMIAVAIKMDSEGPIFYEQERIGKDGKIFKLKKFRSMWKDAEKNGPVWAQVEDNRVTRVGRIIRKMRLDELPQLINVLKQEMSFVGPRPERPYFVKRLEREIPFYFYRHSVRPGITGWAQLCYPYGASKDDALEKLKYDLYYIKNISFLFDLTIILETIKVVVWRKGSR
jgi:sugar transferase (PEP-CTERM system associated)